jgi:hypothetical protein
MFFQRALDLYLPANVIVAVAVTYVKLLNFLICRHTHLVRENIICLSHLVEKTVMAGGLHHVRLVSGGAARNSLIRANVIACAELDLQEFLRQQMVGIVIVVVMVRVELLYHLCID